MRNKSLQWGLNDAGYIKHLYLFNLKGCLRSLFDCNYDMALVIFAGRNETCRNWH